MKVLGRTGGWTSAARVVSRLRSRRLALSIQGTSLRLLLTERQRVLTWAEIPFNPALLRGGFVADRQGMGTVIRNALLAKGISPAPTVASFPGFQSIVRVIQLPRARDIRIAEVLPREARRLMSFSPNEQYLFWRRVGVAEKTQSFLAVAVSRTPLQGFVETLRLAGAPPSRVELIPLCLLKILSDAQAIVANVESNSIDIAIVADSLPSLVRTLWLGDEPLTVDSAPARLAEELNSTINFYNDSNPESRLSPALPVHVAGGFPTDELAPTVAADTGHPVIPLVPSLTMPDGFPVASMAVTCGLTREEY